MLPMTGKKIAANRIPTICFVVMRFVVCSMSYLACYQLATVGVYGWSITDTLGTQNFVRYRPYVAIPEVRSAGAQFSR